MKPVIIITIAVVFLFVPQTVFGIIPVVPEDFVNETPTLDWGIMFVVKTGECFSNHEKALNFYASLTQQYLDKFKIDHSPYFAECITDELMSLAIDAATNYGDLTIVIPDYFMSMTDRHTTGWVGHYGSWKIKTIVSQAEVLFPENRDTGWTLSHELAHFAVDWKGYDNSIMGESVHEVQREYNLCKLYDTTLTHCAYLSEVIQTPSKQWFPVMSPSYVIQVAESMKPVPKPTPVSKDSDGDGYPDSTDSCPTQRENFNSYQDSDGCPDNPSSKSDDNSFIIQKIQESKSSIQSLHKKILSKSFIDINAIVLKNSDFQNSLDSLKYEKDRLYSRYQASYDDLRVANNWNDKGLYNESWNLLKDIENELWDVSFGYDSYGKNLKNLLDKDIALFQEKSSVKSNSQNDKSFVIKNFESVKIQLNEIVTGSPIIAHVYFNDNYFSINDGKPVFRFFKEVSNEWTLINESTAKYGSETVHVNFGNPEFYSGGTYKIEFGYGDSNTQTVYQGTTYFEIQDSKKSTVQDSKKSIDRSKSDLVYSTIAVDYESYPAWLSHILYWYVMEDISPDEFMAAVDYLNDKHIICMGICAR